jgi:hypothetical protein
MNKMIAPAHVVAMLEQLSPLEELILTKAFAARDCHDGTSLAAWLHGGAYRHAREQKVARDVLAGMAKKQLLVTDRMGWFRLPESNWDLEQQEE